MHSFEPDPVMMVLFTIEISFFKEPIRTFFKKNLSIKIKSISIKIFTT